MAENINRVTRLLAVAAAPAALAVLTSLWAAPEANATLIASESFEYAPGAIGAQEGGTGWTGGWKSTVTLAADANLTAVENGLVAPPGYGVTPPGNYVSGPAGAGLTAYRALGSTLDLSLDQDYYVSLLTRRGATAKSMAVVLHSGTTNPAAISFGHSTGGQINIIRSGELANGPTGVIGYNTDISLAPSYLWVLKIAAKSGDTPDDVYLRTYRSYPTPQTAPDGDPDTWSWTWVGTTNAVQNMAIDRIGVAMGSGGTLNFDEIRIGTTWADVVPPMPSTAWNVNSDGNWSEAANWTTVVPNAAGTTVTFGSVIDAAKTVTIDTTATAGRIDFDNSNSYTVAGPGTLTLDATSGQAALNVLAGSHTISAPVVLNDNTTITAAASTGIALTGELTAAGRTITKAGAGTAAFENVRAAGLDVTEGTATVSAKAAANSDAGTSVVSSLSISTSAALDLTNNSLVIDYTETSVQDDIRQAMESGRITSSSADANKRLGYGEASATGFANGTFAGQAVDADAVLVKFTYGGDSNLDGKVDVGDLGNLASNWQQSAPWTGGDFDYNGTVNVGDLGILATNWQQGVTTPALGPSFAEALAALGLPNVSVPEPASIGLIGLGLSGLLRRNRQRI